VPCPTHIEDYRQDYRKLSDNESRTDEEEYRVIRGLYTGASGMMAQQHKLDAISNNMANVDTTGYKRDLSVMKAFPEMLLRRTNDDGVLKIPYRGRHIGSVDFAPVVGKLGTGVEQNEVYTVFEQGSLRQTENPFDIALEGKGFFAVQTPYGERYTRNGSFHLGPEGMIVTKQGFPLLGENGPIHIKKNNFLIDEDGKIYANDTFNGDPQRLVSMTENEWDNTVLVDRLKIMNVDRPRYLEKQGNSMWRTTEHSGEAAVTEGDARAKVREGFLETANVNPVTEMVHMIEVNRAYEANQKVIQAEDESTGRLISQVLR